MLIKLTIIVTIWPNDRWQKHFQAGRPVSELMVLNQGSSTQSKRKKRITLQSDIFTDESDSDSERADEPKTELKRHNHIKKKIEINTLSDTVTDL